MEIVTKSMARRLETNKKIEMLKSEVSSFNTVINQVRNMLTCTDVYIDRY